MLTFIFRCPTTGHNVQGTLDHEVEPGATHIGQHCLACGSLHIVDLETVRRADAGERGAAPVPHSS